MTRPVSLWVVAGIRSQYMKLASLQQAIAEWRETRGPRLECLAINAGQHYDDVLAKQYIDELGVRFDVDLTAVGRPDPMRLMADIMVAIHEQVRHAPIRPDFVLTFGDANTTLATAVGATKAGARLVHVEAGVRLGTLASSEEINRVVADRLATTRFASTPRDYDNLVREGLEDRSFWVGDLIYDLVRRMIPAIDAAPSFPLTGIAPYVLASLHRAENVDRMGLLEAALEALGTLPLQVLFLAHPRAARAADVVRAQGLSNITVTPGLGYRDTLSAMRKALFVFTDSGAFQREAYYLGKRCVIRQDVAFWQTLTSAGVHVTCGETRADMAGSLATMLQRVQQEEDLPVLNDFGNGTADLQILDKLSTL